MIEKDMIQTQGFTTSKRQCAHFSIQMLRSVKEKPHRPQESRFFNNLLLQGLKNMLFPSGSLLTGLQFIISPLIISTNSKIGIIHTKQGENDSLITR